MEEELIRNQERLRPQEVKNKVSLVGDRLASDEGGGYECGYRGVPVNGLAKSVNSTCSCLL